MPRNPIAKALRVHRPKVVPSVKTYKRKSFTPNAETVAAMEAARRGEFAGTANSVAELFEELDREDPATSR